MEDAESLARSLPSITFDTADYPEPDREEAWREHIAPYFSVEPEVGDCASTSRSFQHVVNLGEALVGVTGGEAQVFMRTRPQITSEGIDHFLIQVFLVGGGAMPDRTVEPGDILIIDMGQPHFMLNHDFSHITMVLPRGIDPQLDRVLEHLHGQTLPRRNPQVRLLGQHLQAIWAAVPDLQLGDGPVVTRGLCGLANHLLAESSSQFGDSAPDVALAMKQAIVRFLDENLSSPVSTQEIVQRFNVSRATLYRMFASEGGLHSYLRQRRLTRAYRMLTSTPGTSIGAIGWACGFAGDTQFARAFRNHFGCSPREVRAERVRGLTVAGPASGRTTMRHWLAALSSPSGAVGPSGKTLR